MSFEPLSTNHPPFSKGWSRRDSARRLPPSNLRSRNRTAWWQHDAERTATYLMGLARNERIFIEQLSRLGGRTASQLFRGFAKIG
jgi:hypothetical protein